MDRPTEPPEPPAATARRLIRAGDTAALSTALAGEDGAAAWPYGSLVLVAADHDGCPVLLLSDLAEHSRNLARDNRLSLMFDGTVGLDDPLTGARVTVLGRSERTDDRRLRERYLARHPSAAGYVDFRDFGFYRVAPTRAHLVAGFGRINWIEAADLLFDAANCAALGDREADVIAHMNTDHADAIGLYANVLLGLDGTGWRLTGGDPEGVDLRLAGRVARLAFANPVRDAAGARKELVRLAKTARRLAGSFSGNQR